jgi:predicted metal-binding membrane protein
MEPLMKFFNRALMTSFLWLSFFALILMSWMYLFSMTKMAGLDLAGRTVGMSMMEAMKFSSLFLMWSVMMIAMMFPTMVPTLRSYQDLIKSANGSLIGWIGVLAGYLVVWLCFSGMISAVQIGLTSIGFMNMLGVLRSNLVASILLIMVGLFQFTRLKDYCHGVCHSPMSYFLSHWRMGGLGGLRMGIGLGVFCVGCCWGFMLLGFVGGFMNILWMGLATFAMVVEKLPQLGRFVKKPLGGFLILLGGFLALNNLNLIG